MPSNEPDLGAVEALLGHRFTDRALLTRALTHRSAAADDASAYERLEFQGDRVLALLVCDMLMAAFPKEPEGALSKRLHHLVSRETLAGIAGGIGIAGHIRLGGGMEVEADARRNPSILADVVEASIAALYRDGGLKAARAFVEAHWTARLDTSGKPPKDPKSALQEWAMARGRDLPTYREVSRDGPAHAPVFTIEVAVDGAAPVRAEGTSKRVAERMAAERLLKELGA
ncbi:ribonuclease III [Marivibrio halodurans]|uniref:Ribonuclease 3 n=1 Tax=Marivibrio halodurans TaxID=2039722 RepID=A0A8J7S156_9PROT|nr:ribonuclease III [Marivibrio halodurans]MBP5856723.1 ribonuclease III [Marivibrio halodurans]